MSINIRPLGDKIIVKRLEAEKQTASGIFLPESATEKPQQAKVIRVGTGRKTDDGKTFPFQVKVGDTVILSKWGGTELKHNDEEYLVLSEDEVLAVVE
ncbi:MAG: co-chaperone GroES [Phycisphaeraceae bacterium]|nr:co-chaperone GroES [Phycisphaeraceae bacterium]